MKSTGEVIKESLGSGHEIANQAAENERDRQRNQPRIGPGNLYADVNAGSVTKKGSY